MFHFHQSATNQFCWTFVEILLSICFWLCMACFFMLYCNITVSLFISYHSLVFLTLESLYTVPSSRVLSDTFLLSNYSCGTSCDYTSSPPPLFPSLSFLCPFFFLLGQFPLLSCSCTSLWGTRTGASLSLWWATRGLICTGTMRGSCWRSSSTSGPKSMKSRIRSTTAVYSWSFPLISIMAFTHWWLAMSSERTVETCRRTSCTYLMWTTQGQVGLGFLASL